MAVLASPPPEPVLRGRQRVKSGGFPILIFANFYIWLMIPMLAMKFVFFE